MATVFMAGMAIKEHHPSLQIIPDGQAPFTIQLTANLLNIGSSAEQDIRIPTPGVSPLHARLRQEKSEYRLYRVANNQILINKQPIPNVHLLKNGDVVRFQDESGHGANLIYMHTVEDGPPIPEADRFIAFDRFPFLLGRAPDNNLKLDSMTVSWHHAQITKDGNNFLLDDLKSMNGTRVNDRPVVKSYRLHTGERIQIGHFGLIFQNNGLVLLGASQRFQLDAVKLGMSYTSQRGKAQTTLRDVSLTIMPSEFVCVIGGSGSGKSTLLRALNGVNPATEGAIYCSGVDMYKNYEQFRSVIGYVPQADIVHNELSVYQALWYGAQLRFPNELEVARKERVNGVLESLELEHVQNNLIKTLSGGQKKRVSIALELMAEPSLLFMDEPSSGLDPGLDRSLMVTLRRLADRGHIVIIVTHTIQNIDLCHRLALLSHGNLAYYGPPKDALTHFGVNDYSDVYTRVLQDPARHEDASLATTQALSTTGKLVMEGPQDVSPAEASQKWATYFKMTPAYSEYITKRRQQPKETTASDETKKVNQYFHQSHRSSFAKQLKTLTSRTLKLIRNDLRTTLILMAILPLIGVFLALNNYDGKRQRPGQMLISLNADEVNPTTHLPLPRTLKDYPVALLPCNNEPSTVAGLPNCPEAPPVSGGFKTPDNLKYLYQSLGIYAPANDAQRLLFMMSLAVILLGIFSSAYTIVSERSIFLRERMINLRQLPYLGSKTLIYGGMSLISSALMLIIISVGVRLPNQGLITWAPLEMFVTLLLTALVGVSLGLLISAVSRNGNAVTYLVLAILFAQILLPGVLFEMKGIWRPISMLTVTRWSLEGLGATVHINDQDRAASSIVWTQQYIKVKDTWVKAESDPDSPTFPRVGPMPPSLTLDYPQEAGGLLVHWGVLFAGFVLLFGAASLVLRRSESF